jgi:hypothetical protein
MEFREYRRLVLAYHGVPVVAALVLVGVFLACFFLMGNYLLSGLAAGIPSALLMWRWIRVARQIDRGCPKCGSSFPKKMHWTYPPNVCPHCGERLR